MESAQKQVVRWEERLPGGERCEKLWVKITYASGWWVWCLSLESKTN